MAEAEEKQQSQAEGEAAASLPVDEVQAVPPTPAPQLPEGVKFVWGTGRRKKAIARVRIAPGSGKFFVNSKAYDAFFVEPRDQNSVTKPLRAANMLGSWDIWAKVAGGGFAGQAGAVTLGLARAMLKASPETDTALRDLGLLTRDSRMKERKKYGQKGARRRFQFSKR